MSGITRFLQIIFSIIFVLALGIALALFYPIPWLTPFVNDNIMGVELYRWIVAGILAVIALFDLILFCRALFMAKTKPVIVREMSQGKITITKSAIEATVMRVLDRYKEIKYPKVHTKIIKKPEDTQLFVSFDLEDGRDVLTMANNLQTEIINALEVTLGIPLRHVEVKIHEVKPTQSNEAMEANRHAAKARVQ